LAGVEIRTDSIRLLAKANVFRAFVDKSYGADSNQNDKDIIKIHVDDYVFEPISRNHISVYFTKKTYVNNELESTQRKRASLTFIYGKPGLADGEYALYNPFGFLVDGYKVYDARG
jgi:type IV secretory pathway component VirB8